MGFAILGTYRADIWPIINPEQLRIDNGPELTSGILAVWAEDHQVTLAFIEPGKPAQNGYIERFNRTHKEEILDAQ